MKKKIIITIIATTIITLLFIIAKNLIYGTDTDYIADYMPSLSIIPGTYHSSSSSDFASLAHSTTIDRLFWLIIFNISFSILYTIILFKTKLYETKTDLIYTLIVFILPLIICYALIYSQLGYKC